jgi:hypothetical protein
MARGTTHATKTDSTSRRPTHAMTTLTPDGVVRGPDLSEATDRSWDNDVLRWYQTWRESAQAQLFTSTDWQRLAILAPLVEKHFSGPTGATMSEIRLNEERLGATVVDRMRARMVVETGDASTDAQILSLVQDESDEDLLS